MADKILVKRGLKANLPTLSVGEPAYCTDTKEFFVGTASGNVLINDLSQLTGKVDKVAGKGLSTNDYDNVEKAEVAKVKDKADATEVNGKFDVVNASLAESMTQLNVKQGTKNDIRLYNMLAFPTFSMKSISVMGDSISHGANVPNMSDDSWVGILRKLIQLEYNTKNYGFVHMLSSLTNPQGTYNEVHNIDLSAAFGGWTYTENGDALASDFLYAPTNSTGGIDIYMSKPSKYFKLNYIQASQYGSMDVYVDSVLRGTINCKNASTDLWKMSQEFLGNETAPFKITIIKTGATSDALAINGVFYYDNLNDVVLNNFARSGVALSEISDNVLDAQANANYVFFALGTNDEWKETASLAQYTEKIDHLISTFNYNLCKVVVLDFLWYKTLETNGFKQQMKRLADNTNSIYIDFNKVLGNKAMTTLQQDLGFLSDNAHPTPIGHQMIAEVVAKTIGYSISSKQLAERLLS